MEPTKAPDRDCFPATLSAAAELAGPFLGLDAQNSSPGSMESPPLHSCLSLQSRLLCVSFPWVPWRCEGHSPQVSLPPQAQDPSTGCSWTASSYGSAPRARRGEGGDSVKSGQERAGPVSGLSMSWSHWREAKRQSTMPPQLGGSNTNFSPSNTGPILPSPHTCCCWYSASLADSACANAKSSSS